MTPRLARLEDRTVPATITDGGTANLTITLDNANEVLGIVSNGATYGFTSTNNFVNGGVANAADFSAFGATNLTLQASGLTRYSTINIVDAAAGASVNFNDSGANSYTDSITVNLDDVAAGAIIFNGASALTGANSLSVSTSQGIIVFGTVSASNGGLSLTANQQATATNGNFKGITIQGTVSTSGSGNIFLKGRGGNDAATDFHHGVAVLGGKVSSSGTGEITVDGTGGTGGNQNFGVTVEGALGTITSVNGTIDIKGTGGNGNTGIGVAVFGGGTISSTGVGAGAAAVKINGIGASVSPGESAGFRTEGASSGIKTIDGPIIISATKTVASQAILLNGGTIDSTGGATVELDADTMQFNSGVNAPLSGVFISTLSGTASIDLGGNDSATVLGLTDAELDQINTGVLRIGNLSMGNTVNITISAPISYTHNLTLNTGGALSGSSDIINGSATQTTFKILQGGTSTYSGRIGGPAGGTANDKNIAFELAAGTLKLAGANSYTGTTTVSAGTLIVNGTSGTGNVTVQSGATLGGTGSIGDSTTDVDIQNGAILSPGDGGVGTLTIGDHLTFGNSATFLVDIGPGGVADKVATKNTSVGNGTKLLGNVTDPLVVAPYVLITTSSGIGITGLGFQDVNGTNMPPFKGGPVDVDGKQFNYQYFAGGFRLTAVGTTVVAVGGGNLTITDILDKDDSLTVTRAGANVRISDPNNTLLAGAGATQVDEHTVDVPFASVTGKMIIDTKGGDDFVSLKLAGGIVPVGGIDYDGGAAGNDRLAVRGSGIETAVYTPSATTKGNGIVGVTGTGMITFADLEPIDIDGMALAVLNLPGAGDQVDLKNGFDVATGAVPAIVATGKSGGVSFEDAHFFNNTTVEINTTISDGVDTITITSADNAHGNVNLTITTGTGADSLTVNGPTKVAGNVDVSSGAVTVNADVTATAGNVAMTATGNLTIAAKIDAAVAINLQSNAQIIDGNLAVVNVIAPTLTATAATGIDLDTDVNAITATTSGVGAITLDEANGVTLTNVTTANGPISITTKGATVVTNVVSTIDNDANDITMSVSTGLTTVGTINAGATAGDVVLSVDDLTVNSAITGECLIIQPFTDNAIDVTLGANPAGDLALDQAELDRFTAKVLQIGGKLTATNRAKTIAIDAAGVTLANAKVPTLDLRTTGTINGAGALKVTNLAFEAGDTVTLNAANDVNVLAGTTTKGDIIFRDSDDVVIGNVTVCDGVVNQLKAPGKIMITADAPDVQVSIDGDCVIFDTFNAIDLELSGLGDLTQITGRVLQVGVTNAKTITISAPITINTTNVHLNAQGDVKTTGGTIKTGKLAVDAKGLIDMTGGNDVDTLAAKAIGTLTFVDSDDVTVGSVELCDKTTRDGISATKVTVTANAITVTKAATATVADLLFTADAMDLAAPVAATNSFVTLVQRNATTPIDLGTESAGRLSLRDAELDFVTTKTGLVIGLKAGGAMVVSNTISIDDDLELRAGVAGGFGISGSGSLQLKNLLLDSSGSVALNGPNMVQFLAGTTTGGDFSFDNAIGMSIDAVTVATDTFKGINSVGFVAVTTQGTLLVNEKVSGVLDVALKAQSGGKLTTDADSPVTSTTQSVLLMAEQEVKNNAAVLGNIDAMLTSTKGGVVVAAPVTGTTSDVLIKAGDIITVSADITAGPDAGDMVLLQATKNGADQTAGKIIGSELLLIGTNAGAFKLSKSLNDVDTLAASVNGKLEFQDDDKITVGTVGGTSGIKTTNNPLTILAGDSFNSLAGTTIDLGANSGNVSMFIDDVPNTTNPSKAVIAGSVKTNANGFNIFANKASNQVEMSPAAGGIFFVFGQDPVLTPVSNVSATSPGDRFSITNIAGIRIELGSYDPVTGNGLYKTFSNNMLVSTVDFRSFERFESLSTRVVAVQTGNGDYRIIGTAVVNGQVQPISFSAPLPRISPFVASPQFTNPFGPFDAPYVSTADVNGDSLQDVIVGFSSNSGSPLVTVINGAKIAANIGGKNTTLTDADLLVQFFAYDPRFQGGVFVAAADFDGDGAAEIVTGPGRGQVPTDLGDGNFVKVFKFIPGATQAQNSMRVEARFFAYEPTFIGGVRVAAGNVNGDTFNPPGPVTKAPKPDIVTAAGPGGSPLVRIFNGSLLTIQNNNANALNAAYQFFAYDPSFASGAFVDVGDYNDDGKADILTGAGYQGGPHVIVFDGDKAANSKSRMILDQFFDVLPPTTQPLEFQAAARAGITSVGFGFLDDGDSLLDIFVGSGLGIRNRVRGYTNIASGKGIDLMTGKRKFETQEFPNGAEFRVDGAHVSSSGAPAVPIIP